MKAPLMTPVLFSWTGCYVGVEGGGQWGRSNQISRSGPTSGLPITGNYNLSGGIAGGTIGCNYQFSNDIVIGIENDFSWTDKQGSARGLAPFNTLSVSTTKEKWIDTLRGRVGYAFDRLLVYGTGGVAFAGTDVTVTTPGLATVTDTRSRTGWVAGVGGEWAAYVGPMGAVTVKLEYLHADFGTSRYINTPVNVSPNLTIVSRDVKLSDDMVRVGVNWKFNSDMIGMRY